MTFIKCFTTPVSKSPQINITRSHSFATKCYSSVTKASLGRLSDLVMTYQMLNLCQVTPNYNEVGWTAALDTFN